MKNQEIKHPNKRFFKTTLRNKINEALGCYLDSIDFKEIKKHGLIVEVNDISFYVEKAGEHPIRLNKDAKR